VLEDMLGACLVERRRRRSRGGQGKGIERGRNMIPWLVMIDTFLDRLRLFNNLVRVDVVQYAPLSPFHFVLHFMVITCVCARKHTSDP
jgi:hypothetical protein